MNGHRSRIIASRGSTISNNRISLGDTILVLPSSLTSQPTIIEDPNRFPGADNLQFDSRIISGIHQRAVVNAELLDRVIHLSARSGAVPEIRLAGLFTSFASAAQEGRTSWRRDLTSATPPEYDALMIRERELISSMIKHGYRVRILASLDIPIILTSWGYDPSLLRVRLLDLLEQLRRYEQRYPNFEFAVDSHNRLQGQFIFGSAVLVRSLVTAPGLGYTLTAYETNKDDILSAIRTFDEAFVTARSLADAIRSALSINTLDAYVELLLNKRLQTANVELDLKV